MSDKTPSQAASVLGKIGGKAKTPAKARSSRENGAAPVKPDSAPRGWPKGKKRGKKNESKP
jgi:hypothetical protein